MAKAREVANLLQELHEKKILNLDASLRSVLQPQALGDLDPTSKVASSVIAWDGYGLVIRGNIATIEEVSALGKGIRQQLSAEAYKKEGE